MITWDILITHIPHRHDMLCDLLLELDGQIESVSTRRERPVGVIVYRDNLESTYGEKTQFLLETSRADYVSCVDDDDMVAPDFVRRVLDALASKPDYVGYPVRWTQNGVPQKRIEHSLRHYGWGEGSEYVWRDISEKNPIRRDLALLGRFTGGWEAEREWGRLIRDSGQCKNEVWIADAMYYYREVPDESFRATRQPVPEPLPELPRYPWLTVVTHA